MLSKRNYAMMMTIIIIVLVLFLSSAVLKEYFNDYDVNHAVDTELIDRMRLRRYCISVRNRMAIFLLLRNGLNTGGTPSASSHLWMRQTHS